ncbi:MAG: hypothetical protein AAF581_22535 [Planctomycetota bacterium]
MSTHQQSSSTTGVAQRSIVVCGLGPIGVRVAQLAVDRPGVVAVVDVDPAAARSRLAALPEAVFWERVPLFDSLEAALVAHPGSPVVLSTCSDFPRLTPDLATAARHGSHVVTTCEEALWPFVRHPGDSQQVQELLAAAGTSALAVGINPGFLMDLLPVVLATAYPEPDSIVIERKVDIRRRRGPLQEKVGLGLSAQEFAERKQRSGIGHRGLDESMHFIAAALGVRWDAIESDTVAVINDAAQTVDGTHYPEGAVAGMHNFGTATLAGKVRLRMDLEMSLRIDDPIDRVTFEGSPPLPATWTAPGGVPGDDGTAHVVLAALTRLEELPPGLCTLLDIPGGLRSSWARDETTA